MKRFFIIVPTCLLLIVAQTHASEPTTDQHTIELLERDWVYATVNGDRATVDKLLDDSFIETTATGAKRTKIDVMAAPPPAPASTQTLQDLQVRINGDTAIVTGINRYRASSNEAAVNFAFTDVFARRDGIWRVLSSQMTRK